jgi:hypothetical protein
MFCIFTNMKKTYFFIFLFLITSLSEAQLINDNRRFVSAFLPLDSVNRMEVLYRITATRTVDQYGRSRMNVSKPKPRSIILNDTYKVRFNRYNLENYVRDVMKRDTISLTLYDHALLQFKRRNTSRLVGWGALGATFILWYKYLETGRKSYFQAGSGTIILSMGFGIAAEVFGNRMRRGMDVSMSSFNAKFRY